jgi:hypothetical protein
MVFIAHSCSDETNTTVATEDDLTQNSFLTEAEADGYMEIGSPLYKLILQCSWDAVIERSKLKPREAKQWAVRGDIDSWRRLPLHEACIRQANAEVVKALLDAFPLAAKSFDHSTRLPLHHACFHGCSIEVIRILVGAYPAGVDKKDVFEKTPLILAGSSSSKNKSLIIDTLMKSPEECIVEGHRHKWEMEQNRLLASLQEDFSNQKNALELKLKVAKQDAFAAENEIGKKNTIINELTKTISDLNVQLENATTSDYENKRKIEEMESRFSTVCITNHINLKKLNDKILEQAETIASLESYIKKIKKTAAELKRINNEKKASDAKFTKQVTDLRVTVLEQKMKEEMIEQELSRTRVDLSSSFKEVLALVQKLEASMEHEEQCKNKLQEVTSQLEQATQSNKLLQESNDILQEQINKITTTHEETMKNSMECQSRLENENENMKKDLECAKKGLRERENEITSMKEKFTSVCVTNHASSKRQQDKILEQAEAILILEDNIKELQKKTANVTCQVDEGAKFTKQINRLQAEIQERIMKEELLQQEIKKAKVEAAASRREATALIQRLATVESQLKGVTTELNRKVHEKQVSDSKYTKQMSELLATVQEQKKKEDEMKQELVECHAELLASRREVEALLVQKIEIPNEKEKELENKLKALTNELESAKLSSQLFQQRSCMLQEHISKLTVPCDESVHSAPETQATLAVESEESIIENADCLKRIIITHEDTIKSVEKLICTPANQLMCTQQTKPESDHHPPEPTPSLEADDGKHQKHSISCSTPICVTNIIFH